MSKEIIIEAIEVEGREACGECIFNDGESCSESMVDCLVSAGLPDCSDGYWYKSKELKP